MAPPERPDDLRAWLATGPSLREMRERYPDEWRTVQRELSEVAAEGDVEALARYAASIARTPQVPRAGRRGRDAREALGRAEVRRHLAAAALRQTGVAAATGVTEGPLRFGLVNGWVAQRLLFRKGLERKPVRLRPFRLLWPLLRQRRYLMPLVEPQGIFCFYSVAFVRELAALIGARSALEIAAGDGTLSRFLRDAGVAIPATDDVSWTQISFPADVLREDAVAALRRHAPRAVVCSWPPAANRFD